MTHSAGKGTLVSLCNHGMPVAQQGLCLRALKWLDIPCGSWIFLREVGIPRGIGHPLSTRSALDARRRSGSRESARVPAPGWDGPLLTLDTSRTDVGGCNTDGCESVQSGRRRVLKGISYPFSIPRGEREVAPHALSGMLSHGGKDKFKSLD